MVEVAEEDKGPEEDCGGGCGCGCGVDLAIGACGDDGVVAVGVLFGVIGDVFATVEFSLGADEEGDGTVDGEGVVEVLTAALGGVVVGVTLGPTGCGNGVV